MDGDTAHLCTAPQTRENPVVEPSNTAYRFEKQGVIHRLIRADTFDAEPLKQEGRPADGMVQG